MNQWITVSVFFHWLTFSFSISVLLIFSKIILLISPSSDLHGFIKWHGATDLKFCLWSFNVANALFFAIHSIWSSKLMLCAIPFASRIIAFSEFYPSIMQNGVLSIHYRKTFRRSHGICQATHRDSRKRSQNY